MGYFSSDVFKMTVCHSHTDGQGRMHHGRFLDIYEQARTQWLLNRGISQTELENERGISMVCPGEKQEFFKAVKFEQEISITTFIRSLGNSSIQFGHQIFCDGEIVAQVEIPFVCISNETEKPVRVPDDLREKLAVSLPKQHGSEILFSL